MAFTKVTGPGIHTLSNIISHNIDSSGIITATKFVGAVEGPITGDLVTNDWVSHEGNTITRIGFPDTNKVEIQANSKIALHVDTAGIVGINTNSPSSAHLDIATTTGTYDNLRLRRTSSGVGDSNWSLKPYAGHLYFRQGGSTDKIVFESGGKIGLNTMTVGDTLHIHQLNANHGIKLERGGATNPGSTTIQVHSHGALSVTSSNNITHTSGGSQQHVWMQGSNEAMRIDENRRLGIGTDNPSKTLTIYGHSSSIFRISKAGVLAYDHTFDGSSYTIANNNGSAGIPLIIGTKTAGGESLRITSAGKVGIGTVNPTAKLTTSVTHANSAVAEALRITTTGTYSSGNSSDAGPAISFGQFHNNYPTWKTSQIAGIRKGANWHGALVFYTNDGGSETDISEKLRIDSTGGVGIGTDNFASDLDNRPGLSIYSDHNDSCRLMISTPTKFPTRLGYFGLNRFGIDVHNGFEIRDVAASYATRFLIGSDGQKTLKTNTTSSNSGGFSTFSGNSINGMVIYNEGNDTAAALQIKGNNNSGGTPGNQTYTQLTHLGANLEFEITHAGGRAFNIGSSKRIRVPGVWGVNGSSMRTVQIESDGNLCAPSSIREAKINIESISDVSWLYDFNPVTFNFRTKTEVNGENVWGDEADDGGLQYGLIADEVEAVNQNLCFYDDGKLSGVHYDRMISPLIKAVQDQKKEIDALKAKVAALEGS